MVENQSPQPTGKPPEEIVLTGAVFPWDFNDEIFMGYNIGGTTDIFVPIFSTKDKLVEFLGYINNKREFEIKQIEDGPVFFNSLPYYASPTVRLRLMFNPYITDKGSIRFLEIQRELE